MAKARTVVNAGYQTIATGPVVVTIDVRGSGALYFDEAGDDNTAYKTRLGPGEQFEQTEAVATQVRADGAGWEVIADGTL